MLILLTNDDGIYAPGLGAIERELRALGEVVVVAPAVETKRRGPRDHLPHAAGG